MKRLLLLIVVSALLGGCVHLRRAAGPLRLGASDSGRSVEMSVGQTLTVRLASNPSTGHQWQVTTEPDARVLIVVDSGYDRPQSNALGAAGQAWWRLRATGAGSTSIALRYVRPWEPAPDAERFTLTVTVK